MIGIIDMPVTVLIYFLLDGNVEKHWSDSVKCNMHENILLCIYTVYYGAHIII